MTKLTKAQEKVKDTKVLEELFVSDAEAEILKLLNDQEQRLKILEKRITVKSWVNGYDNGIGAELNKVIVLAERMIEEEKGETDTEGELLRYFLRLLKKRKKNYDQTKIK